MLRSAEEILLEYDRVGYMPEDDMISVGNAIKAINQAVREAIIECGSQITQEGTPIRTREKILNLLNQLK